MFNVCQWASFCSSNAGDLPLQATPANGLADEQLCPKYRGGTLDIWESKTWYSLGDWQLSFPYANVQANGNYGLDTLVIRDSQTKTLVALDRALIAAFNTTEFYSGFFGLGIVSGEFGHQVSDSPFSQMVAKHGWFPSYTYGYTAGAYYSTLQSRPICCLIYR